MDDPAHVKTLDVGGDQNKIVAAELLHEISRDETT